MAFRVRWTHSESSGRLGELVEQANAIAKAGTWQPQHRREIRAWIIGCLATLANLGPSPTRIVKTGEGHHTVYIEVLPATRQDRRELQALFSMGLQALTKVARPPPDSELQIDTFDGENAGKFGEAGALPILLSVAIIAVTGAVAGVVAYLGAQKNELEAMHITTTSKERHLINIMTRANSHVETRLKIEAETGQELPWDFESSELMNSYRQAIRDITNWTPPPMNSIPNMRAIGEGIGSAIPRVAGMSDYLVPLGLLAMVVMTFLEQERR